MTEGILVPIACFAMVFGIIYVLATTKNKERMALIEKGADPELFKSRAQSNSHRSIKYGLFLIGIAIGIVAGYFLNQGGMQEEAAYFSMIFLFGGIALVISFFIQKKYQDN
jgi:Na+/H+-dicarboxylate symporter